MSCSCDSALTIPRGASRAVELTLVNADGTAIDLTGVTILFAVQECSDSEDLLITKSSAVPGEIDIAAPPQAGVARINLVPADTEEVAFGQYEYDVWIEDDLGARYQVVGVSPFYVVRSVVRFA